LIPPFGDGAAEVMSEPFLFVWRCGD